MRISFALLAFSFMWSCNNDNNTNCFIDFMELATIETAEGVEREDECFGISPKYNETRSSILSGITHINDNGSIEIDTFSMNLRLGALFIKQNSIDSGFHYLMKAFQIDSTHRIVNYNLGLYYIKKEEFQKALFYTEKAIRRCPDNVPTLSQKGRILGTIGCYDDSIIPLRRAIELDPDYHPSYINIIYSFNELNMKDSLRHYLLEMDKIFPIKGGRWETSSDYWQKLREGLL